MEIAEIKKKALITAIATPFKVNGDVDVDTFDVLVENQIKAGVDGLVVCGTTGEGHLMSWEEQLMLIGHTVNKFKGRILIIGHTASNYTKESVMATKYGFDLGMDAALLKNPYYGRTSDEGIIKHIIKSLDLGPGIIYNIPSRTAQDIKPELMAVLAKHPNFIGVKETVGNDRIAGYSQQNIYCWSGVDEQSFAAYHDCHGLGVISVASNVIPQLMKNGFAKNQPVSDNLKKLLAWLSCEPNPIPLKSLLCDLRIVKPVFRLPYVPLPFKKRQEGLDIFQACSNIKTDAPPLADDEFIII